MAKRAALTLSKSDDTYRIDHRGFPVGGLLRYHAALGIAVVLLVVPLTLEVGPRMTQVYLAACAFLLLYAVLGYLVHIPFAMQAGRMSFRPKDEKMSFTRLLLGKSLQGEREIPWEGKLETEVEKAGFPPYNFYRVKVVTDFMTYHVATFGPGLSVAAEDLAKAIKKARYGRSKTSEVDALLDSGMHRSIKSQN
jgi:hypothetical protein